MVKKNEKSSGKLGVILMLIAVIGMVLSIWFVKDLDKIIILSYMLIIFFMGFIIGNKYNIKKRK